jgi:hypothetical protein
VLLKLVALFVFMIGLIVATLWVTLELATRSQTLSTTRGISPSG